MRKISFLSQFDLLFFHFIWFRMYGKKKMLNDELLLDLHDYEMRSLDEFEHQDGMEGLCF